MASFSITVVACGLTLLLCFYRFIIYPAFISPLASIPNAHWSAPFSALWIIKRRASDRENRTLQAAHVKHGSVVRLGPKEVSVNCVDGGIRTIYGAGFEKDAYYEFFDNYGVPCMFSTIHSKPHSLRKRMISNVYSKSSVQNSQALRAQSRILLFERLLPLLEEACKKSQAIDVLDIWNGATMDGITAHLFGLAQGSDFLRNTEERHWWLDLYQSRKGYAYWPQEHPRFTAFVHALPFVRLFPAWTADKDEQLKTWVSNITRNAIVTVEGGKISSKLEDEPTVLNALLAGYERERMAKGTDSPLASTVFLDRDLSICSEMLDQLAAGHETSGITMCYASYHLSKDPELQDALRAELLSLDPPMNLGLGDNKIEERKLPDAKQVDSLPLLHAILMETLRVNQAIPGAQPRTSPYPSSVLDGFTIPGGVRVSASAYTLHRVESVYPNAETFDHTRWLKREGDTSVSDRDRYFWAFGSGGKMCIGSNFAIYELKMMIAAIYTNFKTYVVNDEGIEQADGYTTGPKGNKLVLRFELVDSQAADL